MALDPKLMEQLLETFRVELAEQLQVLTEGMLRLEKQLEAEVRKEILKRIFRAAHNIKGAARGVGVTVVADIAHHLESLLSCLKENNARPAPDTIDVCLEAIDRMREAMAAHDAGSGVEFDQHDLYARLEEASREPAPPGTGLTENTEPAALTAQPINESSARAPADATMQDPQEQRNDSEKNSHEDARTRREAYGQQGAPDVIRVTADKLTRISGLSEELQTEKIGLHEQFRAIEEMLDGINGLSRIWSSSKYSGLTSEAAFPEELQQLLARSREAVGVLGRKTAKIHKQMRATRNRVGLVSSTLQSEVHMLRLVPVATVLRPLLRPMRDLARELGKQVTLNISGDEVEMDRAVLEGVRDPLMHLLRNAIDHGIEEPAERRSSGKHEEGNIHIDVRCEGGEIIISVRDDGAGIDPVHIGEAAVRKKLIMPAEFESMDRDALLHLVFRAGFSTRETVSTVSGRGVGLDVVYENLINLKGSVKLESEPGTGSCFELRMPLTLTTERGLQVRVGSQMFVVPSVSVQRILDLLPEQIAEVASGQVIMLDDRPVPLRELGATLDLCGDEFTDLAQLPVVVVSRGWRMVAFVVNEVIGEQEIVIKPLTRPLVSVSNITGATVTGSGGIMMVLNSGDLIETALSVTPTTPVISPSMDEEVSVPRVLIVDDSLTTRTLERNILEYQGYEVTVATDGQQAWETLQVQAFDLVVSDIEMPRMDGFELTERIKQNERLADIPVIIVSSLSADAEKQRGIEVGADAYIVKGQFETHALLEVVQRFV